MSKISIESIQKLREMSGVGMMDCRKALEETNGNIEEALQVLRKKGASVAAKRAENATENGIVEGISHENFSSLIEISCETDFSARTDAMRNFAKQVATAAASDVDLSNMANLMAAKTHDSNLTVQQSLDDLISKICESIKVSKAVSFKSDEFSTSNIYVHADNSVASMVQVRSDEKLSNDQKSGLKDVLKEISMQVAVTNPLAINSNEIDPKLIEKEVELAKDQLSKTTKPASMWDMIIQGKLERYYKDVCLLNQKFIKDDSISVQERITKAAKELGIKNLTLVKFARIGIKR